MKKNLLLIVTLSLFFSPSLAPMNTLTEDQQDEINAYKNAIEKKDDELKNKNSHIDTMKYCINEIKKIDILEKSFRKLEDHIVIASEKCTNLLKDYTINNRVNYCNEIKLLHVPVEKMMINYINFPQTSLIKPIKEYDEKQCELIIQDCTKKKDYLDKMIIYAIDLKTKIDSIIHEIEEDGMQKMTFFTVFTHYLP